MLKRKVLGVLAVTAVAAFSALGASSASAVVFTLSTLKCEGGSNVALCWESKAKTECVAGELLCELFGEQSETGKGGLVVFTVLSSPIQVIECTEATGKGTILQKEPLVAGKKTTIDGGIVTFKGCKLTLPEEIAKKCMIPEEKETKPLTSELLSESELVVKPESGTVFIEIPYTNKGTEKCPVTFLGTHNVSGEQQVTIEKPGEREETKTGNTVEESKLEFFSSKADLKDRFTITFTGLGDLVDVSKEAVAGWGADVGASGGAAAGVRAPTTIRARCKSRYSGGVVMLWMSQEG